MRYRYAWAEKIYEVNLDRVGSGYRATLGGQVYYLEILELQPGQVSLLIGGRPVTLFYAQEDDRRWVSMEGCTYRLERPSPRGARRAAEGGSADRLRAPMPALVRLIETAEGDPVERGQTLLLLEAMKMEIRVKAPHAGRVSKVCVERGQTVERDQILIELGV